MLRKMKPMSDPRTMESIVQQECVRKYVVKWSSLGLTVCTCAAYVVRATRRISDLLTIFNLTKINIKVVYFKLVLLAQHKLKIVLKKESVQRKEEDTPVAVE